MAVSGSSGAYYRGPAFTSAFGLHNVNTIHFFVRATASPSTANFRIPACLVGTGQNPQESILWNHTSASSYKSRQHRASPSAYVYAQSATTPAADTWYSLGSTFDGTNARIYLNGVLEGTSAAANTSDTQNVFFDIMAQLTYLGALDASSQFNIGQMAEVGLWNAALNADEMASLGKGFRAPRVRPQNLLVYAPLIRDLRELRFGQTYVKQAGTDVYTDHPRVIG